MLIAILLLVFLGLALVIFGIWFFHSGPLWPFTTRKEIKHNKQLAQDLASYVVNNAIQIPARPDSELITDDWWRTYIVDVFQSHHEVLRASREEVFDLFNPVPMPKAVTQAKTIKTFGHPSSPHDEAVNVRMRLRDSLEDEIITLYMPFGEIGSAETLESRFIKQYPQYIGKIVMLEYDFDPITHMPASLEEKTKELAGTTFTWTEQGWSPSGPMPTDREIGPFDNVGWGSFGLFGEKKRLQEAEAKRIEEIKAMAERKEISKEIAARLEIGVLNNDTYDEIMADLDELEEDVPPFSPRKYF